MILAEQKTFFEEEGYLIVENILSPEEIEECQVEIHRLHTLAAEIESGSEKHKTTPARGHFQREPYAKDGVQGEGLPVLRKAEMTREYSDVFRRLSVHPNLIEVVQNLIGADLLLFRSTLMFKPAFHGSSHGLHQDSAYWPMEPPKLVTVSIALNNATPENGCFKVIPKSHNWGVQEWGRIAREQDEDLTEREDVDRSGQVDVPLTAGSGLFFHSLMVHGSGPNKSPHPRNTALYAYFSPHVRYAPRGGKPKEKTFPVAAGLGGRSDMTLVAKNA
jgi:ectoine hydroxylase-related dioxygenase (phytanoyl-CoA dioxygenase family)